jgi:hypothetical protein
MVSPEGEVAVSEFRDGLSPLPVSVSTPKTVLKSSSRLSIGSTDPGMAKGVAKNKAENLIALLMDLQRQATPEPDDGKSKTKHYRVIEIIRNFFESGMQRPKLGSANPFGTITPRKQASSAHASSNA